MNTVATEMTKTSPSVNVPRLICQSIPLPVPVRKRLKTSLVLMLKKKNGASSVTGEMSKGYRLAKLVRIAAPDKSRKIELLFGNFEVLPGCFIDLWREFVMT